MTWKKTLLIQVVVHRGEIVIVMVAVMLFGCQECFNRIKFKALLLSERSIHKPTGKAARHYTQNKPRRQRGIKRKRTNTQTNRESTGYMPWDHWPVDTLRTRRHTTRFTMKAVKLHQLKI